MRSEYCLEVEFVESDALSEDVCSAIKNIVNDSIVWNNSSVERASIRLYFPTRKRAREAAKKIKRQFKVRTDIFMLRY